MVAKSPCLTYTELHLHGTGPNQLDEGMRVCLNKTGEGGHMECPYLTYQTEILKIFKQYEYVVLCCVLCENEYKQSFNV